MRHFIVAVAVSIAVLVPRFAFAQVGLQHGTVIVFDIAKDKLTIAADSMGVPTAAAARFKPNYTQCKISVFRHQVIFTGTGALSYVPIDPADPVKAWDAESLLQSVLADDSARRPRPSDMHLGSVARRWADVVSGEFIAMNRWHPNTLREWAAVLHGFLAGGIFAEAAHGIIYTKIAIISFDLATSTVVSTFDNNVGDCWPCGQEHSTLCAGGIIAIPAQFCAKGEPLGRPKRGWDEESTLVSRIAELAVTSDTSGYVGGPIDVLELRSNGTIKWLALKPNCPKDRK